MKQVTAYQTSDGKLFPLEHKELAERHQKGIEKNKSIRDSFKENEGFIKKYAFDNLKEYFDKDVKGPEDVYVNHYGPTGWDCTSDDNPIDVCVYANTCIGGDMCVFCGEPEEGK